MPPELVVIGALNWDINLFVKRLPRPGEEVVVEEVQRVPGGKGGNVSVAAARILGPRLVGLIACVGRDEIGKRQISILKEEGVDTTAVQVLDRVESGQAYISVDEKGMNVIETHFGANAGLKQEHMMQPTVQSILANSSMLVVIDPPRRVAGKILAEGRRLRKSVLWHPGVLTRFGMREFEREMEDLDYLVLNEAEALRFTGTRRLEESLSLMSKLAPKTKILITLGKKGAAFYSKEKMTRVKSVNLERLGRKVVNTTGSGDAFVGAFAASRILGKNDTEAMSYANMAGALKAARVETRGSPGRRELEDAYKKYLS